MKRTRSLAASGFHQRQTYQTRQHHAHPTREAYVDEWDVLELAARGSISGISSGVVLRVFGYGTAKEEDAA